MSLRIVHGLARYYLLQFGEEALSDLAEEAGLTAADLHSSTDWVSLDQFERILRHARERLPNDEAFKLACAYQIAEGYKALRFLFWATSPQMVYARAMGAISTISTISSWETLEMTSTGAHIRYTSTRSESPEMCLSRVAQLELLPKLWGHPPAAVEVLKSVGNGDTCSEYRIKWLRRRRLFPVLLSALAGLSFALIFQHLVPQVAHGIWPASLAVATAAVVFVRESRIATAANVEVAAKLRAALQETADAEGHARRQLASLREREREWGNVLEKELSTREKTITKFVERFAEDREERLADVRGLSHDIRSPLGVIKFSAAHLQSLPGQTSDVSEFYDMQIQAVDRMEAMLAEFTHAVKDAAKQRLTMETMRCDNVRDAIHTRTTAFCHGKPIRVTALLGTKVPEHFLADRVLFDRVLDNILTNAARYTQQGSIIAEIEGGPGRVTIKVSDTGPGIENDRLRAAFADGVTPDPRHEKSVGVGLASVGRLIDTMQGQLEVLSGVGSGTTVWIHLPTDGVIENRKTKLTDRKEVIYVWPAAAMN